ncbi:MAG: hypothetical protein ACI9XB_000784 [Gammaproteobacteria bacterium]|jgi:hypothetical protein
MTKSFFQNLFRTGFLLLFFFALSFSTEAQTLSTTAPPPATAKLKFHDDYSIVIETEVPVVSSYNGSVTAYASNMHDPASAEIYMDQFERQYASINVDFPNLTITLTLDMNSVTNSWTVEQWNEHLKTN